MKTSDWNFVLIVFPFHYVFSALYLIEIVQYIIISIKYHITIIVNKVFFVYKNKKDKIKW